MQIAKTSGAAAGLLVMSALVLGIAGFVAGKPLTLKSSLARVVEQSGQDQCQSGLAQLGLTPVAGGAGLSVAKPLRGSLREGGLDIALALQSCPTHTLQMACAGDTCLAGRPGVSLTLVPRQVK